MQNKFPPVPVRIALGVIILGALVYLGYNTLNDPANGHITASGSIEAAIVNVSPELAGKVAEVLVAEGQSVKADDALLRLDPSLLTAQRSVAASQVDSANAALTSAQTKYDQTLQAALSAQDAQRAKDLRYSAPDEFDQPLWYIEESAQIAAAQTEVDSSQIALTDAFANLNKVIGDLNNANYLAAEKKLAEARAAFLVADKVKIQSENAAEGGGLRDAAYDYYNQKADELDAAQNNFNDLTNTQAEEDIQYARGNVVVAQQRYDAAYTRLLSLQTGAQSPAVISAKNALDQAQSAVKQAQANLDLLDTQLAKLEISSSIDGVILTRNIEPGEFVQPGAVAFTMADLTNITITVYVPENLYGQVSLGQQAEVRADSFPDLTFTATVIEIANQAEFTPRNVQTVEGRSSTFYAIKLKVENLEGKLKIGMPADVVFK
ncbi:MAG: efflux RND transporter periplasmic adaptor subunit [Anaerolineales bacterium]|nr:efflux RND transporter periplasmic adaptor subunit [Anaerolineales bacterium]